MLVSQFLKFFILIFPFEHIMNKKALVAALLALAGTAAYAQTNVRIYGTVDTGYVKETGTDTRMDENAANVIGFKGLKTLAVAIRRPSSWKSSSC